MPIKKQPTAIRIILQCNPTSCKNEEGNLIHIKSGFIFFSNIKSIQTIYRNKKQRSCCIIKIFIKKQQINKNCKVKKNNQQSNKMIRFYFIIFKRNFKLWHELLIFAATIKLHNLNSTLAPTFSSHSLGLMPTSLRSKPINCLPLSATFLKR